MSRAIPEPTLFSKIIRPTASVPDSMTHSPVPSLSVFFPCHNEAENIEALTRKTLQTLSGRVRDLEVIIVNDGSTDHTGEIGERLAQEFPAVKVVHHPGNRGYGEALISGLEASTKELVFWTDGDAQFDIGEIHQFLNEIDAHGGALVGYRINRQDPWHRRLFGWAWSKFMGLTLGIWYRDVDCAFKMFRSALVKNLQLESTGALISAELLVKVKRLGVTPVEMGVHHYPRQHGASSGGNLSVILRAFKELFLLWGKLRR